MYKKGRSIDRHGRKRGEKWSIDRQGRGLRSRSIVGVDDLATIDCYPEVRNIFVNISAETKIFSKIFWDVYLGPKYILLIHAKKTELKNLMLVSL